jgi:hypothetical protein
MRFKKRESLLSALFGTGLYLLENLRERLPDNMDDTKGRAKETHETASDRLGHAADALRGKEDSDIFGKISALLIGVGIGLGVGLLIAPASGDQMRADIADKVSDFGERVREGTTGKKPQGATGTSGE